ncbi:MAG: FAD-dependent oxidoreductase, partial [Candidatus Margulisiibacteriota bacterium]
MIRASNEVAIIGGGLAGLSCAIALEDRGINYKLFEASDRLGGRVHTYQRKKLTVDRGFQILLPNYQICKKLLDYKALDLCYYPNGANLLTIDGPEWFGKPFSYPKKFQHGRKLTPHLSDYICLAKDVFLGFKRPTKIALENQTYLQNFYSKEFQEKFLLPFFRGIFLNLDWNQIFHRFLYFLICFFLEGGAVPKKGMQEIPNQLASKLNPKNIELNTRITQIKDNTIYIKNQPHRFDQIVMATDMSSYYKLMNQPEPENGWNQEYNYIFASKEPT